MRRVHKEIKQKLVPALDISPYTKSIIGLDKTEACQLNEYIDTAIREYSKKDTAKYIVNFMKAYERILSVDDIKIFNNILGDNKLLSKIAICSDGSYVSGRVFFMSYKFEQINQNYSNKDYITVDGVYWFNDYLHNHKDISNIDKLNFMKNNFEKIYIHLPSDNYLGYILNTYFGCDFEYDY